MPTVVLYVVAALTLAVLDAVMLNAFMAPLFRSHIGPIMLESPRAVPALIFYVGYVAGLTALVTRPAWAAGDAPSRAALNGAILGLTAYGTFEFTSLTIMKDWSWTMAISDTVWGGVLTAASAGAAVWAARRMGFAGR
jgi:uncharacterized membrane protein